MSQLYACMDCGKNHYSEGEQLSNDEHCGHCSGKLVTGKPFHLICFECNHNYDGYFNNMPCDQCGGNKPKRYMLKSEFRNIIDDPVNCKIENFKLNLKTTFVLPDIN